ncbi:hypothetical protein [Saccharothrix sp. ST-888]|uniref:hypothetical protein n=1 Tax=Saccharothrix sp. ST-888 TaxID=1427391 RepID=UPI0005EC6CDB|nr:hypothetical protein [Saccharothrix sp. ST-888]KJK56105.1 hypothetical protein UK12_24505 [Saccharothrix sp. ST-888]
MLLSAEVEQNTAMSQSRWTGTPKIVYWDKDGQKCQLRDTQAAKLNAIADAPGPIGRFEQPSWRVNEVRALEDRGLIVVTWLETGDAERRGAWRIEGLTELGDETVAAFNLKYVNPDSQ